MYLQNALGNVQILVFLLLSAGTENYKTEEDEDDHYAIK
jgi:hypothetical protein